MRLIDKWPQASTVAATTPRATAAPSGAPLVDPFGRHVTYLRLSVTDRCDLRCTYCMAEDMTFLPKQEVLSLEELDRLASAFVTRGLTKLRLTGGEPLVRRGIMDLVRSLSRHLNAGLNELTLTTNGTQLAKHADALRGAGVARVNVSLDTLDETAFARLTRGGKLAQVMDGLRAAKEAGLAVKLNAVLLAKDNADTLPDLIAWAHGQGFDMTLIEAMPMGEIEPDRFDQHMSLTDYRERLSTRWTLTPDPHRTGGPATYARVAETGGRLGFITPLSHKFCEACNRVRVTCTGRLYLCLGQEEGTDLRAVLRSSMSDAPLHAALDAAIARKPEGHDFRIDRPGLAPASPRHMSVTGG